MHTRGGLPRTRARGRERGREGGRKEEKYPLDVAAHTDVREIVVCLAPTPRGVRVLLLLLTMDSDDDAPPDLVPLDAAPQPPAPAARPQPARTREGRPPVPVTLITGALVSLCGK